MEVRIISYNVRLGDVAAEVRSHQALSSHPVELVAVGASVSAGGDYLEGMLVNGQLGRSIYSFGGTNQLGMVDGPPPLEVVFAAAQELALRSDNLLVRRGAMENAVGTYAKDWGWSSPFGLQ